MSKVFTGRVIRILLIGPLPPPMGGDTRHFATLVGDLESHSQFSVKLINTSRGQDHSKFARNLAVAIKTIFAIVYNLGGADIISHHASDRGIFQFGPFVVGLGKLTGKPTVLRLFGGSFGDFYEKRGKIGKAVIRKLVLSADVVLLQTKRTINQLQGHATGRLEWFSTYIKVAERRPDSIRDGSQEINKRCSKFIFLGHLWQTKGLETILEAASRVPEDCRIDIFGPPDEYTAEDIRERGSGRVHYGGFLTHSQVDTKLWEYDCLVLPTYHNGEGYPGVIAEAFAHGLPVITTRFQAIPEIVDDECGILIEPGNTDAFVAAVTALYEDNRRWRQLKEGARSRAARFDHAIWSKKFEDVCEQLAQK